MIERYRKPEILRSLSHFPVVGLLGARQVGKTTLAREIAKSFPSLYLDLERPSDRAKLSDPEIFLPAYAGQLVILDEIQRVPEIFPVLRSLVDDNRRPGRFLILGSASPDLLRQSSESLAGRVVYHELDPFILSEIQNPAAEWKRLWFRGGYPGSYLADSESLAAQWREAFIHTHLERDIPAFGIRVPAVTLYRFWQMLAHSHGQLWNASQIAASLQVSAKTASHYLTVLEDSFMVRRLQPYSPNLAKRLVKSPKVYLRDSGLLHALLNLTEIEQLYGHSIAGLSWEGWALEQVLAQVPPNWRSYFYRTSAGAEMDLVLEKPGEKSPITVEFKFSTAPAVTKGFWSALEDLKPLQSFVVAPVPAVYPLKNGVQVLPVDRLSNILQGH